jgi:hypothetical protein
MSEIEAPSRAALQGGEARPSPGVWAPGVQLMQPGGWPRMGGLLLLCAWLPALLLGAGHLHAPRSWVDPFAMAATWLLALYLTLCFLKAPRRGADTPDTAARSPTESGVETAPQPQEHGGPSVARGDAGAATHEEPDDLERGAAAPPTLAQASHVPADASSAVQLRHVEVRMATAEIARRTVVGCGLLDASTKDLECASADLGAIQDEMGHTLRVMAGLRARLLSLSGKVHAISRAALRADHKAPANLDAAGTLHDIVAMSDEEIEQCHRLTERIGEAERNVERRVEALQRSLDRLAHHAQRGMDESHQVMGLTRQVQAAVAESKES